MSLTKRERNIIDRTYFREIDFPNWASRIAYAKQVAALMRIARKLDRINEIQCNEPDDKLRAIATKRGDRLEAQARSITGELGIKLYINGDPRGASLKINLNQDKWRSCSDDVDYLGMDTDLLY